MDSTATPRRDEQAREHGDGLTPASPGSRAVASGMHAPQAQVWQTARGALSLHDPRVVGILNVTPDSFADGGLHATLDTAVAHAEQMLEAGADMIDIGGESTRPGTTGIGAEQERSRVLPVLREIVRRWPEALVSVDTVKSDVARAALEEGAAAINDVSALRLDPAIADLCAQHAAGLVLMHSRGGVNEMASYSQAVYGDDAVGEMVAELRSAAETARARGCSAASLVLDPGLGFAKRTEHSVAALAQLDRFRALGYPVLVGPSRKRFVGEVAGDLPVEDRLPGTIAACVSALHLGARLFRVHDVLPVRRALLVAEAVRTSAQAR
jgi:dihydropteroate synthase